MCRDAHSCFYLIARTEGRPNTVLRSYTTPAAEGNTPGFHLAEMPVVRIFINVYEEQPMKKIALFTAAIVLGLAAQGQLAFTSVRAWPMPAGHTTGYTRPGFKVVPTLSFATLGTEKHLVLKMEVTLSSGTAPVAPFSYLYTYNGKEYTDRDLGFDVFKPIRLQKADFMVRVQGPGVNENVLYESVLGRKDVATVSKDAVLSTYSCSVQSLENVYYSGTETIHAAINALEAKARMQSQPSVPTTAKVNTPAPSSSTSSTPSSSSSSSSNPPSFTPASQPKTTAPQPVNKPAAKDDFWSEKKTGTNAGPSGNTAQSNVIPEQPIHKSLPDFVRTTDGGYYHRGEDGRFRKVSEQEYQQAKTNASNKSKAPVTEEHKMTAEEAKFAIDKMFNDARARDEAITNRINQISQAWQQNYYYSEAIRNGKKNLEELSTLSGDYSSIEQLQAEFNQKYNSIRGQVQQLEDARNAKLTNAVNANFNGSGTEQAIGQGVALIGSIFNSAKASKEEREAKEALRRERERQEAAIKAARLKARTDLRNQLVKTFPAGGTPLTAHKITLPEVYMFGYVMDPGTIGSDISEVSVSNVFPVAQYSDGTYPLKTVVANRIKGIAKGDVVLVGFYGDKKAAEQMRTSFLSLAQKSEMSIRQVTLKTTGSSSSGTASSASGDFWETGKKTTPTPADSTKKKSDFWNN